VDQLANSVGHAWAILKGHMTGDIDQAKQYLMSMPESERILRNRHESRARARLHKRKRPLGQRV
jgi:hypothetical protein